MGWGAASAPYAEALAAAAAGDQEALAAALRAEEGLRVDEPRDDYGNTPLMVAARHGHRRVVRWCVSQGADLDHTNRVR